MSAMPDKEMVMTGDIRKQGKALHTSVIFFCQIFRVQSELLDDLKATAPYKRPLKSVTKYNDAPVVYGEPLPP
jgi:hypothetical protein